VNQVRNASPVIRRKDAAALVYFGRAEWVGADQVRLVVSHPENRRESAAAAVAYSEAAAVMVRGTDELRHIPMVGDPWKALMLTRRRAS
jgi:hypothetical protein